MRLLHSTILWFSLATLAASSAGEPRFASLPALSAQEDALARFDADGDGVLSEAERATMRATFRAEREAAAAARERSSEVQAPSRPHRPSREEAVARFDRDGDGELSEEERGDLRAAFRAEREAEGAAKEPATPAEEVPARALKALSPEELLARFDADGDGELSEEERGELRAAFRAEREAEGAAKEPATPAEEVPARALKALSPEELLARFDADGDGELSEEERGELRSAIRAEREAKGAAKEPATPAEEVPARALKALSPEELLARFDVDGDGELDESERAAFREARQAEGGPKRSRPIVATEPEKEAIPAAFRRFDRDRDGALSAAESRRARAATIEGSTGDEGSSSTLPEMARRFDGDGNGVIDEQERAAAKRALRAHREAGPEPEKDVTAERAPLSLVDDSRIAVARAAVAEELARREKVEAFREKRLQKASKAKDYRKASLGAYRLLAAKDKGGGRATRARGGQQQGARPGKKRGSDYYNSRIQRGGRGNRQVAGRGNGRNVR